MEEEPLASEKLELDIPTRIIHMGLMVFGVLAWLSGGWAGGYEHAKHLGFTLHSWLGMGLASFIVLRLIFGLVGPACARFTHWVPYTKKRLLMIWEDILVLLRFRMPDRPSHVGIAGLVQTYGLLIFTWMAMTGSLVFSYLQPGKKAGGLPHFFMEIHEIGEGLIPVFLTLHVGAVILHALAGRHKWRRVLFLKEK